MFGLMLQMAGELPYAQSSSDVDPAVESFPSGQLVQEVAPSPLKVFSSHC